MPQTQRRLKVQSSSRQELPSGRLGARSVQGPGRREGRIGVPARASACISPRCASSRQGSRPLPGDNSPRPFYLRLSPEQPPPGFPKLAGSPVRERCARDRPIPRCSPPATAPVQRHRLLQCCLLLSYHRLIKDAHINVRSTEFQGQSVAAGRLQPPRLPAEYAAQFTEDHAQICGSGLRSCRARGPGEPLPLYGPPGTQCQQSQQPEGLARAQTRQRAAFYDDLHGAEQGD